MAVCKVLKMAEMMVQVPQVSWNRFYMPEFLTLTLQVRHRAIQLVFMQETVNGLNRIVIFPWLCSDYT